MRILLCGYDGHMGREVRTCAERAAGCEITAGVDPMTAGADPLCVKTFGEVKAEAETPAETKSKTSFIIFCNLKPNSIIFLGDYLLQDDHHPAEFFCKIYFHIE